MLRCFKFVLQLLMLLTQIYAKPLKLLACNAPVAILVNVRTQLGTQLLDERHHRVVVGARHARVAQLAKVGERHTQEALELLLIEVATVVLVHLCPHVVEILLLFEKVRQRVLIDLEGAFVLGGLLLLGSGAGAAVRGGASGRSGAGVVRHTRSHFVSWTEL